MVEKNEKYVVIKRKDLEAYFIGFKSASTDEEVLAVGEAFQRTLDLIDLDDAVVIRRQDKFAAPAFHMYACGIQLACSIAGEESITDTATERLLKIADYFHEQGELAADEAYKLPD